MIKFSLQASPNYKGVLRVREYFMFSVEGRPDLSIEGLVDDSIRNEWKDVYTEWRDYIDRNDTVMYEAAKNEYLATHKG